MNSVDVLHVRMNYKQSHCCDVCHKTYSTCDNSTLCVSCRDGLTKYNRRFCRGIHNVQQVVNHLLYVINAMTVILYLKNNVIFVVQDVILENVCKECQEGYFVYYGRCESAFQSFSCYK
ncbi:hypothetical protein ENUP19_0085G0139 [Entamoeba nuttalli]|uniref:Uncharacterized protein n=1 Tax=Entamoeba nuttalli TaxID=412467 RepID=A0ABQ0DGD2_9EUKA